MFENLRRGRQARNFTTNVPKILVLKSSSEQIFFRKLPLGAPVFFSFLYHKLALLLLLLLLLSRSIKLWNAVHIMSSIGRITKPTPLEKLYLEVEKVRYET